MRFFFIWFILSLMVGVFANGKGRSAAGFFLLSMLTSPLIGFAVVFALARLGHGDGQKALDALPQGALQRPAAAPAR